VAKGSWHGGGDCGVPVEAATMGSWRWRRPGPGGGSDDRVSAAAAGAPDASLPVWRQFSARETKFCEVIQAKRRALDL
jgi:hypothetical protein